MNGNPIQNPRRRWGRSRTSRDRERAVRRILPLNGTDRSLTVAARWKCFAFLLPCLLLFTAGCAGGGSVAGYSHEGMFDESVRTIAVPIFENRSFYREAEFKLTEALTKEIEHRTPYKVTREGGADTMITGTILSVDQQLLSRTRAGLSQEVQVVVTVGFEWKDLRSGEVLRARSRIEGTGEFIPTRGVGEPFEVARHAAVDELSRQIVSVMRGDW